MKKTALLLLLIPIILLSACKDDDDDDNNDMTEDRIELNLTNLPSLAADEQYEGWIIVDGDPLSTGKFTVDMDGNLSETNFMVEPEDLSAASDFVLSIEPLPDTDPSPSAIKILGGSFSGNTAEVSASHAAALGTEFNTISGQYILATPTTSTNDDELSGIWFLNPNDGNPQPTLDLPSLSSNWMYEGWAVIDGQPVTSGKFSSVSGADDSAPYSGDDGSGPPFPGEDFVQNAPLGLMFPTNLSGGKVVVSIEPNPDNSPAPFLYKPLAADVSADATDHMLYAMMNNVSGSFPAGNVVKK